MILFLNRIIIALSIHGGRFPYPRLGKERMIDGTTASGYSDGD
ncbi:hypothetical protein TC41_0661 [Alicyclobacillus acidocaldarius subsp. acidocaldarius Tc-4-1]|uniref:Uncharacterized protein n=1 Tax=Alicyclobacillus acidocaldarius (strain Tc-4-1) TaxID=1048834 RepID=F8IDW6_ALIAT|nr:hypothetical protein TC41_0661 [Alicyclobacillus acidocaldarius subsp. acidocaldarius Tc-4-1]